MNGSGYYNDKRYMSWALAVTAIATVGYFAVVNPELIGIGLTGLIAAFLVTALALMGVSNPMRPEGKRDDDNQTPHSKDLGMGRRDSGDEKDPHPGDMHRRRHHRRHDRFGPVAFG